MNVAIPYWKGRISPVFDVARQVLIVEIVDSVEKSRRDMIFDMEDYRRRANLLSQSGVDVLICGAISKPLEVAISTAGIEVISQICGDIERVLQAFIAGLLDQNKSEFLMPGCCRRRRRLRGNRRSLGLCRQNEQKGSDEDARI